jgi:hypothetical protein
MSSLLDSAQNCLLNHQKKLTRKVWRFQCTGLPAGAHVLILGVTVAKVAAGVLVRLQSGQRVRCVRPQAAVPSLCDPPPPDGSV